MTDTVLTDLHTSAPLDTSGVEPPDESYMDVLGNKCLWKKTLTEGRGRDSRPQSGDQVTLKLQAKLSNGSVILTNDSLSITLGDCDVTQALDIGVMLMEIGEQAELISAGRYAYGVKFGATSEDGVEVSPNSTVYYNLELLSLDDPVPLSSLALEDRIAMSDKKRARGNDLFNREEFILAIGAYGKAVKILEESCQGDMSKESSATVQELIDTKVRIYNNIAASQMRIEAYDAAIVSCDNVLKLHPNNVKALFRKGKSLVSNGELQDGLKVLRSALQIEPDSRLIQNEVAKATLSIRRQQSTSQALYRKMLGVDIGPNSKSGKKSEGSWWSKHSMLCGAVVTLLLSVTIATAYKFS